MNYEKKNVYDMLMSARFALSGEVPSYLRALVVKYSKDFLFDLFFYYHGEISEDQKDHLAIDIEGEFFDAIFDRVTESYGSDVQFKIETHLVRLDEPAPIPKTGYLAYKRYEPGKFDHKDYLFPDHFKEDFTEEWGSNLRPLILISAQKVLLNRVEENLREVIFAWDDKNIRLYFYYDNAITELNRSLAQAAADEFIRSFPNHKLEFKILLSDELDKLSSEHDWSAVFSRGKIV